MGSNEYFLLKNPVVLSLSLDRHHHRGSFQASNESWVPVRNLRSSDPNRGWMGRRLGISELHLSLDINIVNILLTSGSLFKKTACVKLT